MDLFNHIAKNLVLAICVKYYAYTVAATMLGAYTAVATRHYQRHAVS